MEITQRFEVHPDIEEDLARELAARVRLRFSLVRPKWWELLKFPVFTVTGPESAVQAIADEIRAMEREASIERTW